MISSPTFLYRLKRLLLSDLLLVKGKLRSLKDIAVTPSTLAWPGGDLGEKTSTNELVVEGLVNLLILLLAGGDLPLDVGGSRDLHSITLGSLLDSDGASVVGLVPLLERVGVDEDNGSLHEGLGTHELVVGGVVVYVKDPDLAGADLGSPGEVSGLEALGAELQVSSPSTNGGNLLVSDLGHGRLASHLELPLLVDGLAASSGFTAFVARVTADSHIALRVRKRGERGLEGENGVGGERRRRGRVAR